MLFGDGDSPPPDPFMLRPVVVGSRGMERWLRHEIASRRGVAARLAFPFPRQAIAGTSSWAMGAAPGLHGAFWDAGERADGRWRSEGMAFSLIPLLRALRGQVGFEQVEGYLGPSSSGAVSAREWAFARDVAAELDELLHSRPDDALAWARDATQAGGQHRWLAHLLGATRTKRINVRIVF